MRDLDPNLLTAQKQSTLDPAIKITLSLAEQDDVVIERDRIYQIPSHEEEPYSHTAEVLLDNSDGYFTDKDLKSYKAVISWGLVTKAGKKYSDTAPLWVIAQELTSAPGKLLCRLILYGIPNLLAEDRASESYIPEETDTKTVKTLLTEIITATLSCYSHCPAYEVVWDSDEEDDPLLLYLPKDSFRIYTNDSRLAKIRRLLDFTHCVPRFGADGKIHILKPVTTDGSYDYEYSLEDGHPFFSKAHRRTMVIPNYVTVKSRKDDDPKFSGFAKDESYDSLPDKLKKHQYFPCRLESNQQATDIAEAVLGKYQLHAEMGSADVPMDCGAEVFDYDKVAAFCAEDVYRVGNIGALRRTYNPEKRIYNMRFSFGGWLSVRGLMSNLEVYPDGLDQHIDEYFIENLYAQYIYAEMLDVEFLSAITANMGLLTAGEIRIGTGVLEPTGTATGGSNTTLEDSEASWGTDEWAGENIRVVIDQVAYTREIVSNTATEITFNALPESIEVSEGDSYYLGRVSVVAGDDYWLRGPGSGTATDGSTTTLEDTTQNWEANEHIGKQLRIIKNGNWYQREVKSNTSNTLTFEELPLYEPFTGFRFWTDGELGRIAGFKDGTMEFYTGSDGKLYAGGGAVVIDALGLSIKQAEGEQTYLRFYYGDTLMGYIDIDSERLWLVAKEGYDLLLGGDEVRVNTVLNVTNTLYIPSEA